MIPSVVVVGGGLAGALVARALDRRGVRAVVVDAGDEPGGVAVPVGVDGYLLEPAAGTLMLPHPHLSPLLAGLSVDIRPAQPAAANRLVYHRGRVHQVPAGPALVRSGLLSPWAKLRVVAEAAMPGRSHPAETVTAFMTRRFGRRAGKLGAWLAASGVHAGDPDRLSVDAAFPMLAELERQHGSVVRGMFARRRSGGHQARPGSWVVGGGVASVAAAIAGEMGGRWRRSFPVEGIRQSNGRWLIDGPERLEADRLVLAVAPAVAGHLLGEPAAVLLAGCESAPVAVVWLGVSTPVPDAIGMLVGPDEGFGTLGFLFESAYAPERAPPGRGLVKAIVGGASLPHALEQSDDRLIQQVTAELGQALGSAPEVVMTHVVRHVPGIPQYTADRSRLLAAVADVLPLGVSLAGWGYDGVGIAQLAGAATTLASRLAP